MKSRVFVLAHSASLISQARLWILIAGTFTVFAIGASSVSAQSPNTYYKRGQQAEARDDVDGAYQNFQKAYSMDPKNEVYRTAFYRVRFTDAAMHVTKGEHLVASGDEQGALVELLRAAEIYSERFTLPSGRVAASFEVLFLHGWAPHDSQPKPLKPGSAARRLADALGAAEQSAGEKVERS